MSDEREHEQAFVEKMQRLRHTGVGGVEVSGGLRYPASQNGKVRQGDRPADMQMKVEGGWVVANAVSRNKKGLNTEKKAINNDGSVKVFAMGLGKSKQDDPPKSAAPNGQDTEESIINEIIALQRKLSALKAK